MRPDRGRVETAFGGHLAALGLPRRSVRWARDVRSGSEGCTCERDDSAWLRARAHARLEAKAAARAHDWRPPAAAADGPEARLWAAVDDALAASHDRTRAIRPNPVVAWLDDAVVWDAAPPRVRALPAVAVWRRACAAMVEAYEQGLGYFWVLSDEVVAVPRPVLRVEAGVLHAADGPAVGWPGGEGLWFWQGIRVPRRAIEAPETLRARDVHEARNLEVRRVLLERMGYDRYLREQQARLVAEDEFGRLWRCAAGPGEFEPLVVVEVLNSTPERDGSRRRYFLRVPPRTRTPHEAVAWSFGLTAAQYRPQVET